jgi:hypothetical protein
VVGADGVAGQGALSGKMAAEFRQRRAQWGRQALDRAPRAGRVIRASRRLIPWSAPGGWYAHGHSLHRAGAVGNDLGATFTRGVRRGSYYVAASAVTMRMIAVGLITWQVCSAELNSGESGSMPVAGTMAATPLADGSGKSSIPCVRMQAA